MKFAIQIDWLCITETFFILVFMLMFPHNTTTLLKT